MKGGILSLRLQNIESHKNTFIEFSPGLTVIVGDTDKGKSGFFRGYQWLTENTPNGEWMRPLYWEGKSVATGVFADPDLILKRVRSNSINSYILDDKDPVNAGTSVPEDIKTLLDLDSVNLQTQSERAFLMFETAGERGRILNRIAGLDKIESSIANANSDVNRLNKAWKNEKAIVKQKREELESFVDIEDMERRVAELTLLQSLESRGRNRITYLKRLLAWIGSLNKSIEEKEVLLPAEEQLLDLQEKQQQAEQHRSRLDRLKKLLMACRYIERKEALEDFQGAEEKLEAIQEKQEKLRLSKKRAEKLKGILSNYLIINKEIKTAKRELVSLQAKIPNICTECGREL